MKNVFRLLLAIVGTFHAIASADTPRDRSLDSDWRFLRADAGSAEQPGFDDSQWRKLDVPHDWSIEDLPAKENAPDRIGPFDPKASENKDKTGNMVGGIGWYRKHFTLNDPGKLVTVRFDGVYMNSDVWINGHALGNHPNGYTGFEYDISQYVKPSGQDNVLAVRVKNEGKNSRWYSGSGIYRHVWLTVTDSLHIPFGGVFVTTPEVSKERAVVKVATEVQLNEGLFDSPSVKVRIHNPAGEIVASVEGRLELAPNTTKKIELTLNVPSPTLWSPGTPSLYTADVEVSSETTDTVSTRFGIRKIEIDAEHGLRVNGEPMKLMGGCIHHDNGPLGSAAIDRAEERKVELMKANGFNAIRTTHNPPSPALLDACDRLGMLVIDEAFDQWNQRKMDNEQDYHGYFKDWFARDIASMVRRDRNHPSVIIWSIGNEIPEQFHAEETAKALREAVLSNDSTRPITAAICSDWGKVIKDWAHLSDAAFAHLDIGGYNYLPERFEGDHARHPDRVMMTTESYPQAAFDYWSAVEKHPYVIGDFVWTSIDYLGESGIGQSTLTSEKQSFFMAWPWFDAWCGDLDICGFKKPQSLYRDVLWRRSPLEVLVHAAIPSGQHESISGWGWRNEQPSWNWPGHEGTPLEVSVYSRCDHVRLELNGKPIGEKAVSNETKLTARFDVPYAPGELRTVGLVDGKVVAEKILKTAGAPRKIKLAADRSAIHADRNYLAYVTVEVVDDAGQRVPNSEYPVHFTVSGVGELAAQGSGVPNEPASFRTPVRRAFEGRCLAILRPTGGAGEITLRAEAEGLEAATIGVAVK